MVVPHETGLLRLSKMMFSLNHILHHFPFERGTRTFHIRPPAACLESSFEMDSKSFVFGEYKELRVRLSNPTGEDIDRIWLINDKPLDLGHVIRELGPLRRGGEKEIELAMRATVNERKGDVNFLVVFETNGVLRSSFKRVSFSVANSFKTKCLLEQLDQETFLVLIDLFDKKEHFIQEALFDVQKIILLSNVFEIDLTFDRPFRKFAEHSTCDSLIYFILRKRRAFQDILRKDKEVFFRSHNIYSQPLANMLRFRGESNRAAKARRPETLDPVSGEAPLKKDLLLGFLEQENRAVRNETRENSRPDLFQDYKCSEFIDFCLLWTQRIKVPESSLFGNRKATLKYKLINGQHSIINTALNSVAFRIKHNIEQRLVKKFRQPLRHRRKFKFDSNIQDPIYRVKLVHPREIEHDFAESASCKVDVEIRVTCLFKGAREFSRVHLDKPPVPDLESKGLESEAASSKAEDSTSRRSKWLTRLKSGVRGKEHSRPRYMASIGRPSVKGNPGTPGLSKSRKRRKPQLILKLSNIHQVDDSESGSSRTSSVRSSKRKELGSAKYYPVMIWQGNRNISIENLEENHDFVIKKKVAFFGEGIYDLNQLKVKSAEGKVHNLSIHEKCFVRIK